MIRLAIHSPLCSRFARRGSFVALALVSLGFALPSLALARPSEEPFALVPGSFHVGVSTLQAGAHEDLTTEFDFNHDKNGHTFNDARTVVVNLPAGFDGNNTAVPTCTFAQLLAIGLTDFSAGNGPADNQCPVASQIGTITFDLTGLDPSVPVQRDTFPVYNMETTSYGVTAEFAYNAIYVTGVLLVSVRPGDSGLTVTSPNIEQRGEPHAISVTTWGVPAAPEHDPERGMECFAKGGGGRPNPTGGAECFDGGQSANIPAKPFLSNPTSCGVHTATIEVDSWEHPDAWSDAQSEIGPIGECERVPFAPKLEVQPTTNAVESPSGLDVSLLVPQSWEDPYTVATANLENTRVTLPAGYTVNPSAGNGLVGCTPAEYEAETSSSPPGAGCPPESKLGKVNIETPVLAETIKGNVYLAQPYDNRPEFGSPEHPGGSLLALYIVGKAPDRGIIIKAAGKVEPNPVTGQLVTTFENTPQQPFDKFTLEFKQGQTSPLVSPPACGSYTALAELTPWSAPEEPRPLSNTFQIEHGIGGGVCPSGGVPPFHPQVVSGTQSNAASTYSPFYLRIIRQDGEQELTRFSTTLPPGLTGNLTGIPFCSEADIQHARQQTGAEAETSPACPAASEIGHTLVGAGVGSVLAQTPGKVYLAGPYNGAPLSIVSVTSAKVGPFDLGTVVIRFALDINPTTAQVEVSGTQSEAIPHIIKGIVVHVREIRVYMNKEKFIINPTSCNPMNITDTIDGAGANFTIPTDQVPVAVNTPFQGADCSSLTFKPNFTVSTSGKTSKADGANLTAKLTVPAALGTQANIKEVKVDLPKQLPSRLTTLQKACTAAQFNTNPAGCPAASNIGYAKAITPILPVPLEGPVYFVSHGGEAFPSLEIVLQGYGFTIDLVASTFISKAGITSSTFHTVPDQPVTSFEITLPEGKYSALAANGNLCRQKLIMPTAFTGQNGAVINQDTHIEVTGCPNTISILSHSVKKHTLKLSVYGPASGKLTASGKGVSSQTKSYSGQEALTFTLRQKKAGKLSTKIKLIFTPKSGKKLSKSLTVKFKQ